MLSSLFNRKSLKGSKTSLKNLGIDHGKDLGNTTNYSQKKATERKTNESRNHSLVESERTNENRERSTSSKSMKSKEKSRTKIGKGKINDNKSPVVSLSGDTQQQNVRRKSKKKRRSKKANLTVSFAGVEVRKYPIILGDHPDCHEGPPITIDWECYQRKQISLDKFESKRENQRRKEENLYIESVVREGYLKGQTDVTEKDIARVMKELKPIKKQRKKNIQKAQEAMSSSSGSKFFATIKDIIILG